MTTPILEAYIRLVQLVAQSDKSIALELRPATKSIFLWVNGSSSKLPFISAYWDQPDSKLTLDALAIMEKAVLS
jgi:hypothetical protein